MNSNYHNTTMRQIPEVDDLDVYAEIARLCCVVTFMMWFMGHALNCCISPFADNIYLKMKEYDNKLDEAEDTMCEYEEEIEFLKKQLEELSEHDDECRKIKRSRID